MKKDFLLFYGGTILTMNEKEEVEACAVRENKIIYAGTLEECKNLLSGEEVSEVNLEGQCLLPGFIDPHAHLMMYGMSYSWIDISYPKVQSISDLIDILSKHKENVSEEGMIRGFGFDQRNLKEKRYPTAAELDKVATDRPVQIMHVSGHCNVLNHYFLDLLGIDKNTEDPEGGVLGRDANGELNGQLYDSANDYIAKQSGVIIGEHGPNIHMPDSDDNLQNLISVAQEQFLASGITAINDPQVTKQEMKSYQQAQVNGLLKLRVKMSFLSNYLNDVIKLGLKQNFGDDQLSLGPIKLYADGSLNSGTAYLSTEFRDSSRNKGYLFHEPEEFQELLVKAHVNGFQTLTHAQGDGAIQLVIDSVKEAQSQCPKEDIRHRIEHCGLPSTIQINDIAEMKLWPVPQPQHVYQFGNGVVHAVGDYGENYSPYGWFKKNNIPIVLSSDAPVAPPHPLLAIYAAVTRSTVQGNVVGPDHKITLNEALQGYTIEAAKAMHQESLIGSIEEGKLADLVVLAENPYNVPIEKIKDIQISETWISGKKVFQNTEFVNV
ncbi:amidohydrolase [Oceanobacillus timonensis]|uniref:amidohydrolase n=1 Tax=Oceanobacillus timonensis TaxID=1926285 RepID=UPI0009B969D4|nr:amidohydrolase [Oceanobacillus timonensis]